MAKKKKEELYHEMESKQYHPYDHTFDMSERNAKGDELVQTLKDIDNVKFEKSAEAKKYDQQIKDLSKEAYELRTKLAEGKEKRNAECVVKYNADLTHVYVFHPDTGEVIYDRDLDFAEQADVKDAWDAMQKKAAKGKKTRPYVPGFLALPAVSENNECENKENDESVVDTEAVQDNDTGENTSDAE